MEGEIGVIYLEAKDQQRSPETTGSEEEDMEQILPQSLRREHSPADNLISDFNLQNLERIHFFISFVISHSPGKLIQLPNKLWALGSLFQGLLLRVTKLRQGIQERMDY